MFWEGVGKLCDNLQRGPHRHPPILPALWGFDERPLAVGQAEGTPALNSRDLRIWGKAQLDVGFS